MLGELLRSIVQHTNGITYEMIVVDNYSEDGTVEMIKAEFPNVLLIENQENRGVARSRNQALKLAKGRYRLLLDADMLVKENSCKALIDFMDKTPNAGICTAKLTFADGTVQHNARRYPTPIAFLLRRLTFIKSFQYCHVLKYHEMEEWDRSDIRDVDYVIGACQMIRDEAYQQVGMLDENIFYGPEDIDYCLRMYKHGWKIYYYPFTMMIHYEQRITKKKLFSKISLLHLKGIMYLFYKYGGRLTRAR
jgi:hypothetical protein